MGGIYIDFNQLVRPDPKVKQTLLIPERDVYRLTMRSKLPSAERFEEWVVGEVLPQIRKTGSYAITKPTSQAEALLQSVQLMVDLEREQKQIKRDQELLSSRVDNLETARAKSLESIEALPAPEVDLPEMTARQKCNTPHLLTGCLQVDNKRSSSQFNLS